MADSTITALSAGIALVGAEVFPADQGGLTIKISANQIKAFVNSLPLYIGTQANGTKYPTTLEVLSDVATSDIENHMIGFASERTATFTTNGTTPVTGWGLGIYGKGWTNGGTRSAGIVGEGMVTNTTDTGFAVGIKGYSQQTHSGGLNIGVYGSALGGSSNYDFYSLNGTITSATGTLINTGSFVATASLGTGGYTVAALNTTLPPASNIGKIAYVTDALTPAWGATVVGGGAVTTLVFCNGTSWTAR